MCSLRSLVFIACSHRHWPTGRSNRPVTSLVCSQARTHISSGTIALPVRPAPVPRNAQPVVPTHTVTGQRNLTARAARLSLAANRPSLVLAALVLSQTLLGQTGPLAAPHPSRMQDNLAQALRALSPRCFAAPTGSNHSLRFVNCPYGPKPWSTHSRKPCPRFSCPPAVGCYGSKTRLASHPDWSTACP